MKSVSETGRRMGQPKSISGPSLPAANRKAKFSRASSVLAMATMLGLIACNRDFTLSYLYAPSETASTAGLINAYGIDNQTGALHLLADSPVPSGGRKPVAIAAAPNERAIYIINHDDSNVVEFTIGTDGKLYPENTYNTTGSYPVALAVSADNKYLYVAYTYQSGFTTASPGPGGISTYPINSDNSLGTPVDFPIGRSPVSIAVSTKALSGGGSAVYLVSQDSAAVNPVSTGASTQTLNLFAFMASSSNGQLSALPGETIGSGNVPSSGYATGIAPSNVLEDASGTHLYITDFSGNIVIAYAITANGVPNPIANGVAATGAGPMGMTIDPSGKYFYLANSGSGSVSGYTFGSNGEPVPSTVAASTQAGTGTNCVTVEPTHGIYLYASGLISNTITGEEILPADGSLKPIIRSPYAATALPICAVAVAKYD